MIGVGLLVYLSTWAGWFQSSNAYFRRWAVENPAKGVMWLPEVCVPCGVPCLGV